MVDHGGQPLPPDDPPPLILCESRSLAGVLQDIASTYLCPIAATNGQVGGFLHTDVGPLIREGGVFATRRVLYFGALDLSGGHIEENTRGVLEAYAPLDWTRLAITGVQVRERGLTVVEKKDNRFKPARTFPAVETEALRQREIQRILLEALEEAVPQPLCPPPGPLISGALGEAEGVLGPPLAGRRTAVAGTV